MSGNTFDNTRCTVCLDKRAQYFCVDCKYSSGICDGCWTITENVNDITDHTHGINCVICKKRMWYSLIQRTLKVDVYSAGDEEVLEKLVMSGGRTHTLLQDKHYDLSDIQFTNAGVWDDGLEIEDTIFEAKEHFEDVFYDILFMAKYVENETEKNSVSSSIIQHIMDHNDAVYKKEQVWYNDINKKAQSWYKNRNDVWYR